jgi:hypothetical protein
MQFEGAVWRYYHSLFPSMENAYVWNNLSPLLIFLLPLILGIAWSTCRAKNNSHDEIPMLGASADKVFAGVRTKLRYIIKGYEMIYMAYGKVGVLPSYSNHTYSQGRASHCYCVRPLSVLI